MRTEDTALPGAIPYPVSVISVSGLYRLASDHRTLAVPGAALAPGEGLPGGSLREAAGIAGGGGAEQEYAEPEIVDEGIDALLSGPRVREELRLDVDGEFPQMTASGSITLWLSGRVHWVARLRSTGRFSWAGPIWFREGDTRLFPYSSVAITVKRSLHASQRRASVVFRGVGVPQRVRAFRFASAAFRAVDFEFDFVEGIAPVLAIDTAAHPNRPPSLPAELLSLETVFRRAGFRVTRSAGGAVPIPDVNPLWTDLEMHDAMQAFWSRFSNRPQWALWTFLAAQHEMGPGLGGIMFDDIGAQHRQGTAIFYDSFISQAPAGDSAAAAWVDRMRFWTAAHEMGHAFNLAHSWQKSAVVAGRGPWIGLADDPEARSFMNYPDNVNGRQTAFFADFEFRFSDPELLFLRHAPERFVQMGNAEWFDHHGFEQAAPAAEPSLKLEVRVNRPVAAFEFLEPVVMELKLTNVSEQPALLPDDLLSSAERLTVIVKRAGAPARSFVPFAQYCRKAGQTVLRTGQSVYESLFVAAGRGGWLLSEAGHYVVQVCLHLKDEDVVSNPLALRIAPPVARDEELLAQDFFSDAVGRVLAFDGSRHFVGANDTLLEVTAKLPARRVSAHARVALSLPSLSDVKRLEVAGESLRVGIVRGDVDRARAELQEVLGGSADAAAQTLGHIDYNFYLNRYGNALEAAGGDVALDLGADTLRRGQQALKARGVLPDIVEALDLRIRKLAKKTKAA